jgi:membrane protease YdiL (CAAX protease family)
VLFGLLHPITPTYAVLAALMGAYLGGVWLASGNLLVPIVAHALYDFIALAYLLAPPPGARGVRRAPLRLTLPGVRPTIHPD